MSCVVPRVAFCTVMSHVYSCVLLVSFSSSRSSSVRVGPWSLNEIMELVEARGVVALSDTSRGLFCCFVLMNPWFRPSYEAGQGRASAHV
jgi:hypothetical protein